MELPFGFVVALSIIGFIGMIWLIIDYNRLEKENTKLIKHGIELTNNYKKLADSYKNVKKELDTCKYAIECYEKYIKETGKTKK